MRHSTACRGGSSGFVDVLISEGETQLLFVSHHAEDAPSCITHRLEFVPDREQYRYLLSKID